MDSRIPKMSEKHISNQALDSIGTSSAGPDRVR